MKKTSRILITLVMVTTMLLAVAFPTSAAGFDFEKATKTFNSNAVNTFELNVGEQKTLLVAWQGYSCFTSDSSVVVISDDCTVTAVGEGTAYAAIAMSDTMYMLYRFDVVDDAKNDTTTIGTVTSEKDDIDDVTNEKDDTIQNVASEADKETSSKSDFDKKSEENDKKFEEESKRMMDEYEETSSKMFKTFGIIAGIILALGITGIVVFVWLAKRQNSKPSGKTVICPTCNAVQPYGTDVCPICGTTLGK